MRVHLKQLAIRTRQTTEEVRFSESVTFLYGPVSTGKSTIARLVDYCLGGDLERTPAIQQEFLSVELALSLGPYDCLLERGAHDTQYVRASWGAEDHESESLNVPLRPQAGPLVGDDVFNLSDLIFYLCGVTPIKVRQRTNDPDAPLIRLSIRDVWWYCYLEQLHLDSSFFRFEDPFKGRKSQDAMRFFTGLHSERLSQLEGEYNRLLDEQRTKREAVKQIRAFMKRFDLGSEIDVVAQLTEAREALRAVEARRAELERTRSATTHPSDQLRQHLRSLGTEVAAVAQAIEESGEALAEQRALRAEFVTAKLKAERLDRASVVLGSVHYQRCPQCGTDIAARVEQPDLCGLCGSATTAGAAEPLEQEVLRRDLNERIDQLADAIERRENERARLKRRLVRLEQEKAALDQQLQRELARYDSAFVESIRTADREVATLTERIRSLQHLMQLPQAIDELEEQAGALQGRMDGARSAISDERLRLRSADANVAAIAEEFKRVMLAVGFPGVSEADQVVVDPRNWRPVVVHGDQQWSFWDTGSGGKKTLFNVCYALAVHAVALERDLPVPSVLLIDSPTKNISEDENPELVRRLYEEIYRLARGESERKRIQFVLIDSDLVLPEEPVPGLTERRLAGEPEAPSLISYYVGP
jgi:predicted  nucleic acid-binding Zn-ribbon protein